MFPTLLRIYVLGLIILVPDSATAPDHMDVYLADGRGDCHPHTPFIGFTSQQSECPAECGYVPGFCGCILRGGSITLLHPPVASIGQLTLGPDNNKMVPTDESDANNIEWLVRMRNANGVAARIKGDAATRAVAKMSFSWDDAEVCQLAGVTFTEADHCVKGYRFGSQAGSFEQAMAEVVMFEARVPARPVVVQLEGFPPIRVPCTNGGCNLIIGNSRRIDESDSGVVGTDFAHYYDFALTPPAEPTLPEADQDVPKVKNEGLCGGAFPVIQSGAQAFIEKYGLPDQACKVESKLPKVVSCPHAASSGRSGTASAAGRPICPMVIMDP